MLVAVDETGLPPASRPRVVVIFERIGPYHFARLRALGTRFQVVAIELVRKDSTYEWSPISGSDGFERLTLFDVEEEVTSLASLRLRLRTALTAAAPDVVFVPGWRGTAPMEALRWCLETFRPVVVLSASTKRDAQRAWAREWIKAAVVRNFDAALVGGTAQLAYLADLGFDRNAIAVGYDVVDNQHYASAIARHPRAAGFLCCSRFVLKKNLFRMLEAYSLYSDRTGEAAWPLTIVGDGPLRAELTKRVKGLGLAGSVFMPGFVQYEEMPKYYAKAACFVHPSSTEQWGLVVNEAMAAGLPVLVSKQCGCVEDLVVPGVNGHLFDPERPADLADLLSFVSGSSCDREAMGEASREIIAEWGLERFVQGATAAIAWAFGRRRGRRWAPLRNALLSAVSRAG